MTSFIVQCNIVGIPEQLCFRGRALLCLERWVLCKPASLRSVQILNSLIDVWIADNPGVFILEDQLISSLLLSYAYFVATPVP